jgi:biotin synthase-like enzyme
MIGNYLTTSGRNYEDDFKLIEAYGLSPRITHYSSPLRNVKDSRGQVFRKKT